MTETGRSAVTGDDPKRYYLSVLGPVALGVSLGLQVMMTVFMFLGPGSSEGFIDQLTDYGKTLVRPEHDLPIYVAGVVFSLVAILAVERWWRRKLSRVPAEDLERHMVRGAIAQGGVAVASMVVYLALLPPHLLSPNPQLTGFALSESARQLRQVTVALPSVLALVCAVLYLEHRFLHSDRSPARFEPREWLLSRILLYATPPFIILVIFVPPGTWSSMAAQFYLDDGYHHLNYFMMGPALSFAHDGAFGTEIYSQYGIGWPLVASELTHLSALTYGNLIGLEIVYGCVYYIALFFLLRACFQQAVWATLAVLLAIYWQLFSGMDPTHLIWLTPSSTVMRQPLDLWLFLALVLHQRSGRIFWIALAGFASAFGIFFVTETGVYLLATFPVYWVLQTGLASSEGRLGGKGSWLSPLFLFYGTAAAALLPLLFYASRGTLFTAAFWGGWLEPLVRYSSWGIGALPIAKLPIGSLVFFVTMLAVYLAVLGWAMIRSLRRAASKGDVLLATVAAYGLALLLNFVSRSHPYNLCHPTVPFAVVLTALAFQCRKALAHVLPYSSFPYLLSGGLALLLLIKPEFRHYPSLPGSFFDDVHGGDASLISNFKDFLKLPPGGEELVRTVNDLSSAIQIIAPDGNNVAILDINDTLLYCAANAGPWSRYATLFYMALTKQSLEEMRKDLLVRAPKCMVIRGQNSLRPPSFDFVWAPLYDAITNRCELLQTVGRYEIWVPPNGALAHCRSAADLDARGQTGDAIAQYTAALRLDPDLPAALNNLARIRAANAQAQFRDGAEAVRLAERACRLTRYQQPLLVGTLAAAYAEAGRFDEASATVEKARGLALAAGQKNLAEKDQQLLELFKLHRPYHEPEGASGQN